MKTKQPKVRHVFSYSFTQFEADQIERAAKILSSASWTQFMDRGNSKRTLFKWAVIALAGAVVRDGKMPIPLAVEMRRETREETEKRCGRQMSLPGLKFADEKFVPLPVRISPECAAAFEQWRKIAFKGSPDVTALSAWVLEYVAANLDRLRPEFRKLARYCESEQLNQGDYMASRSKVQAEQLVRELADDDDDDSAGEEWKR